MPGITGPGIKGSGIIGSGIKGAGIIGGGGGGGGSDPFYAQVRALLHMDGADGSTVYIDEKGHNFANTGAGPTLSTSVKKFGTASFHQPESSNFILSDLYTEFTPPTQYTCEMWVYFEPPPQTVADTRTFAILQTDGGNKQPFQINLKTATSLLVVGLWGGPVINGVIPLALSTWHHIALTRNSSNLVTLWVNGVADGSSTDATIFTGTGRFLIGNGAQPMRAFVDEFRFTSGVCRYTAPFIPPTAPFPNS